MKEQIIHAKPFKHSYFTSDGLAEDVDAEVVRYERISSRKSADLQLLGISNAHIGFNEPGTHRSHNAIT